MLSHNPYFNRWFSAIQKEFKMEKRQNRHNPYFNRWFSAILFEIIVFKQTKKVTILILIDGFLQYVGGKMFKCKNFSHNPYFNRWFSAI